MEVLLVLAHPDGASLCGQLAETISRRLHRGGHRVDRIDLYAEGFDPVMSSAERVAYETDAPLLAEETRRHAELVRAASGLVFVYPTVAAGLPAILKGWLDRVLVTGVAFVLDPRTNTVRPALHDIRRLGVVTTNPMRRTTAMAVNDAGRRTLLRTLRLVCHPRARRTQHVLYRSERRSTAECNVFVSEVDEAYGRWR